MAEQAEARTHKLFEFAETELPPVLEIEQLEGGGQVYRLNGMALPVLYGTPSVQFFAHEVEFTCTMRVQLGGVIGPKNDS